MENKIVEATHQLREVYFLTQILGTRVINHGHRIGKLGDVIIKENGKFPEVTEIYVVRRFGNPSLIIPLARVKYMSAREIVVDLENLEAYEGEPKDDVIMLRDHILDKKVLDIEDREVEVVYDVKMVLRNNRLYVSDVDLSKYGLLRRMHLKLLADWIYKPKKKANQQILSWSYIQPLPSHLGRFKGDVKLNVLKEHLADVYPADVADILEELDREQRTMIFQQLDPARASDILEEIDPNVQRDLIFSLSNQKAAELVDRMTPGQAADVLSALSYGAASRILALLEKTKAEKIRSIMQKQEATIFNFATQNYLKLPPNLTAAEVRDSYPKIAKDKDVVTYIYVTDEQNRLLGVIDLKQLLKAEDQVAMRDIMVENIITLNPTNTIREAYNKFARYNFRALPITDKNDKILGIVPYRDIMNLKHRILE